jgi:hypothetical protein
MIQAFLLVLHNSDHAAVVEVCFSILQPHMHGLLDRLVIFIVLTTHVIF